METKSKYKVDWELLASYLSGNATDLERIKVQKWLGESEANKTTFQKAEKVWNASQNAEFANVNVGTAWNKVNSKAGLTRAIHPRFISGTSFQYLLRIAAILTIGFIAWFLIRNFNTSIIVTSGQSVKQLALNDGSQVTLNHSSQFQYPKKFKGNTREVFLKGEAFFNIARNPQKPFIIHTENTQIKVLGTSFNVHSDIAGNVEVIVNTGTVSVTSEKTKQNVVLHKDEKAVFNAAKSEISKGMNTDMNYLSWKTKKFIFHEAVLKDVFDKIESVYNIRFIVKNSGLNNCRLTATYDNLSADEIVKMLGLTFGLKISWQSNAYVIEGIDCKK